MSAHARVALSAFLAVAGGVRLVLMARAESPDHAITHGLLLIVLAYLISPLDSMRCDKENP